MENKATSIQIYENTRKELLKVIGQLQSEDGNKRNYDEAISELIRAETRNIDRRVSKFAGGNLGFER